MSSHLWGLTQWSGSLAHIASDLGQACQKYVCTVHLWATYNKDGHYHKGYLSQLPDGTYWFSYKSHIVKKQEDWGAPLPNLATTWQDLCVEGLLLPGHNWSTFDCSASAHHDSTRNLLRECPHSLLLGGPVEKWPFFQMNHMTNLSTQIHSSISQYDISKVSLKKIEWKVPFGCVKVDILRFGLQ